MEQSSKWWILSIIIISTAFVYLLSPILTPFLIAMVFAYVTSPLVNKLSAIKIPRSLSVFCIFVITFIIIFLLFFLLVPLIERQVMLIVNKIPALFVWLQNTLLPCLNNHFEVNISISLETITNTISNNWQTAGNLAQQVLLKITQSSISIVIFMINFILVLVVAFYLMRDWNKVTRGIHALLPPRVAPTITRLLAECNDVLGSFFRGQLLVMLALAIAYSFGLSIIGLNVALIIGIIAGLISFVPYLGFTVGLIAALIASFVQFNSAIHLVYVVIVFGIGTVLEGMILTPLLVGDKIGLHPVAVIFAVLAGGQLFGFTGVLLALPVAAVLMVFLRYINSRYVKSELYQAEA